MRLDPEGETLPIDRLLECCAMKLRPRGTDGAVIRERVEPRMTESQALREGLLQQPAKVLDPKA